MDQGAWDGVTYDSSARQDIKGLKQELEELKKWIDIQFQQSNKNFEYFNSLLDKKGIK